MWSRVPRTPGVKWELLVGDRKGMKTVDWSYEFGFFFFNSWLKIIPNNSWKPRLIIRLLHDKGKAWNKQLPLYFLRARYILSSALTPKMIWLHFCTAHTSQTISCIKRTDTLDPINKPWAPSKICRFAEERCWPCLAVLLDNKIQWGSIT